VGVLEANQAFDGTNNSALVARLLAARFELHLETETETQTQTTTAFRTVVIIVVAVSRHAVAK
jgi:hypothetical protein